MIAFTSLLKITPTQVFSCKKCEIFKNIFFHRIPPVAASEETIYFPSSKKFVYSFLEIILSLQIFFLLSLNFKYSRHKFTDKMKVSIKLASVSPRFFTLPLERQDKQILSQALIIMYFSLSANTCSGIIPSTYLLPVPGSRNSILN